MVGQWGFRAGSRTDAPTGRGGWVDISPDDYLRWAARYLWSGPPQAFLCRRFPALQGAEQDILNTCFLGLATTAENKASRNEVYDFADEEHAKASTNRALRNAALQALRVRGRLPAGVSFDALAGSDSWATLDATAVSSSISGSVRPLPGDPQAVLDRVQSAVREAVLADDRYDCPSCGHGDLVSLTLGVVEEARDHLDDMLAPDRDTATSAPEIEDAFDRIGRTTPAVRSVYRAMARAKGDEYVFTSSSKVQDRAKALLRRCRPCVERILDEVIAWLGIAPEDWTGEAPGADR